MSNILDNYLVKIKNNIESKQIKGNIENKINVNAIYLYAVYTNFIRTSIIRSSVTPEYIDNLSNIGIQGIVFSSPKKQMYAVIINKLPKLIFSAGLMRLAMNLEAKCSKKSKIVIVNALKFI